MVTFYTMRTIVISVPLFLVMSIATLSFAHGLEEESEQSILTGMSTCLASKDVSGRLDCYVALCDGTPNQQCVIAILETATELGGAGQGVRTLNDIMTAQDQFAIRTDGHDLIHVVGRQAARHFGINGETFSQCSRDYFYGCEHGFFEIALAESDSPVDAANQICGSLEKPRQFVCYHGVGHGLMMAYTNDVERVIPVCDQLPKDYLQDQGCWQGAYMENINALLRGEAKKGVFIDSDPLSPCSRHESRLHRECYINHAARLMQLNKNSLKQSSSACLKEKNPVGRDACLEGLGQLTANPGWQELIIGIKYEDAHFLRAARELCEEFPSGHRTICYTAAVGNLLNYDAPELAIRYCDGVPQSMFRACQEKILGEITRPIFPDNERAMACEGLTDDLKEQCSTLPASIVSSTKSVDQVGSDKPGVFQRLFLFVRSILRWMIGVGSESETSKQEIIPSSVRSSSSSVRLPACSENTSMSAGFHQICSREEGFFPADIIIHKGDTVIWVNDSDDYMWPASDVHPTHEMYSAFDSQKPITSGGSWSFTFDQAGVWTFHDHLFPDHVGTVTVRP